ncbi:hypothetical protein [Chryseobacterium defluvii]|uniref:Uncharacterized protein n=1 Tax=Chryseobacterium defluvii TaxID=160396 RepID=A0A495SC15_9FLAO|nr:hypothetical protein [Chryseobacterium defluvii]RKS97406.1 hypothetical protein BCF58_1528 [Chryseobacterium defluvii]
MEKDKAFKYNTDIVGTTKVHSIKSDYKINIKNEVTYKGIEDDGLYRFNIVETLYELADYEDPIMTQIAEMTNRICSIYKEIEIGINAEGVIEKIYNRDEIRKKWQKVKEWLTNSHPLESYEIIRAKEYELSNEEMEIKNIRFIHFLHQYFFIFKQSAENGNVRYIKKNEMDRFGGGIVVPVNINLREQDLEDGTIERTYEGKMVRDNKVIERLRTFTKDKYMHPEYKMTGKYMYDNITLLESDFTITEELGEFYYNHSYLRLTLEE